MLLNRLLNPVRDESAAIATTEFKPILPKYIPWGVKKQMLEAESRAQAKILREKEKEIKEAEKPLTESKPLSVEEIEEELGVTKEGA